MKDLSQLQNLSDFVDDAAFIRDVSKVKQVETNRETSCFLFLLVVPPVPLVCL